MTTRSKSVSSWHGITHLNNVIWALKYHTIERFLHIEQMYRITQRGRHLWKARVISRPQLNRSLQTRDSFQLLIFLLFSFLLFLHVAPPIRRGWENTKEKERRGRRGKTRIRRNVLAPSNVSLKPRRLQMWQIRGRRGEADTQVDHLYFRVSEKILLQRTEALRFSLKGKTASS